MSWDGKYRRIFTEADMLSVIRGMGGAAEPDAIDDIIEEGGASPSFPADEPIFVLRAQDRLACEGIEGYLRACEQDESVEMTHTEEVAAANKAVMDWQHYHPERVRTPDTDPA